MKVVNKVETILLSRYHWLQEIVHDRHSEFMGNFANIIADNYRITKQLITIQQANSMIERIHQMLGNII